MLETFRSVEPISKELIDGFIRVCDEVKGWKLREDSSQRCSRSMHLLFDSITQFLAKVKSTEKPVGFLAEDPNQNVVFGAKVEYFKNANEDMPGNWAYSFTFNPQDDLKDCIVYRMSGNEFKEIALAIAEHYYGFSFNDEDVTDILETKRCLINTILCSAAKAIKDWVDQNSVSPQSVTTEIKGKVIIDALLDEEGHKVASITPSGELKNIIKDDAAIEQAKEKEKSK